MVELCPCFGKKAIGMTTITKRRVEVRAPLTVVELFAGVGGFRLGLEGPDREFGDEFRVIWSNQWEPGSRVQHASDIYIKKWGEKGHSNVDIAQVGIHQIPDHDLLVGGFPCQDYSVARTLSHAAGIVGKKGVLWWEIHRIIEQKGAKKPSYLMLENVDRLLKSPATQRGRDAAIMLASLSDLGYIVEWRIINAADYGMPQRRRRIFFMGYKKGTPPNKAIKRLVDPSVWFLKDGIMASAFPVKSKERSPKGWDLRGSLSDISTDFNKDNPSMSPFHNAGIMINRRIYTTSVLPDYGGKRITLGDILIKNEKEIQSEYFIADKAKAEWERLKNAKSEPRKSKTGFTYHYTEGKMAFPDQLDKPSRTIVTGEGGSTPSRFKHVIETASGRLRRLTPVELELLNMFPPKHTELAGVSDVRRAFLMGNALVVGVIERLGRSLAAYLREG
jgi:DNA (cytosine-5)-methyltransferase 1